MVRTPQLPQSDFWRARLMMIAVYATFGLIAGRLFYWQIIKGPELLLAAEDQYRSYRTHLPSRGKILTADGYTLVENKTVYRLFAEPQVLQDDPQHIAKLLTPLLFEPAEPPEASQGADIKPISAQALAEENEARRAELELQLLENLTSDRKWIALDHKISDEIQQQIAELEIHGLGFDPYEIRAYPEASMAAHVTGFVGKNDEGQDTGYFGVEGALDKELRGLTVSEQTKTDAKGNPLLFDQSVGLNQAIPGRDVTLTIRRDIQFLLEKQLQKGIQRYGALSGEIVVVEPSTGRILGLAAWPHYDQASFFEFEPSLYKNPSLANTYEPGSTFKVLTVAAGIDAGLIKPDTTCSNCDGPRRIANHTIRTWNDVYHPDITMTEALAKSDNIAMIYIAEQLGKETFLHYLDRFKIGQTTDLELQEDTTTPLKDTWRPIDLATASFGQGIVTNSLQLTRAVAAIANQGHMMQLQIIDSVYDPATNQTISMEPQHLDQVISAESAATVTSMMISAAEAGEAQWTATDQYTVAAKTGTSQVAENGEYAEDKTIASFIGFAPAENPKFVMLVKLQEPSSSPWAAETAAPLWYETADQLLLLVE